MLRLHSMIYSFFLSAQSLVSARSRLATPSQLRRNHVPRRCILSCQGARQKDIYKLASSFADVAMGCS